MIGMWIWEYAARWPLRYNPSYLVKYWDGKYEPIEDEL